MNLILNLSGRRFKMKSDSLVLGFESSYEPRNYRFIDGGGRRVGLGPDISSQWAQNRVLRRGSGRWTWGLP